MRMVPAVLLMAALSGCAGSQLATANALVADATVLRKPQGGIEGLALALVSPTPSGDRATSQERSGATEKSGGMETGTIVVELHRLPELYAGGQIDPSDKSLVSRQILPMTLPRPDDPALQSYLGIPNVTPTLLQIGFTQQRLTPASYVFVVRTRNDSWRSNPIEISSGGAAAKRRGEDGGEVATPTPQTRTVVSPSADKSKAATVNRKPVTGGTAPETR